MSLADVRLHLVDDLQTAQDLMSWLGERREINELAIDSETSGLSQEHDRLRLVQIGDAQHGWAIPWIQWGGVFLEAMRRYTDGRIICHNLSFDMGMIRGTCGYQLPQDRCDDTRLMAHVLDPGFSTALKPLAGRHVDPMAMALQDQWRSSTGWTWETVPVDYGPYWQYAAMDCVLTARLAQVLRPRLIATHSQRAYELELAASWVCERMERNGIMVDRPYASEALERFQTHARALSDWCSEYYGVRTSQNASVAQRLMQDGIVLDATTASGAVQMDKEVLGGIDHPLAQVVLEHRRYSKLASTYLRNFMSGTSDEDPRLHPRINTVGAVTGRMSMQEPNLQNLPRNSEDNPAAITVRNCLVASEGHTLLMTDYSQIELRILAHIAQDPGLIAAFDDEDVFTSIARELFVDPTLTKKDERRGHTKNAMYALSYGAGAAKFAKTAGLSDEQGEAMYSMIAQRYPKVKGLGRLVETKAAARQITDGAAYAKSPLTGRRHPMNADKRYGLVNALVQGTAAEVLKQKLIELDAASYAEYLVLPVHDEVIMDVPTEQIDEIARDVSKIMSDDQMFSVPLTTDASTGQRWGEKTSWIPV
jgi:DNA polymerase-1